jgi:hypothetical protein
VGEQAEDQGAMRDGFVAWNTHPAAERRAGSGRETRGDGMGPGHVNQATSEERRPRLARVLAHVIRA